MKVGVWLIGACGNVGVLTIAGARAIARGIAGRAGLVTDLREFRDLPLPAIESLVFGGHEVSGRTLLESAKEFAARAGVLTDSMLRDLAPEFEEIQKEIRPGYPRVPALGAALAAGAPRGGDTPRAAVRAIGEEMRAFQKRNGLRTVVAVNVATTERASEPRPEWNSLGALRKAIDDDRAEVFPPSMLYAYAALDAGFPYVNFTPSVGASVPALDELARARACPHAGRDGKTGETLVKTTLAPLFALRNLKVLAWEGYNMLGNRDGLSLRDPQARSAKATSKDRSLRAILGDAVDHSSVHIDYVPSLDDWKVAFDYIHFEGFLGAKMAMQFTWQGCDSALAAPLVLDLARLAAFSQARGESGALPHLACFFKDPHGVEVHSFAEQFALLRQWAGEVRAAAARSRIA